MSSAWTPAAVPAAFEREYGCTETEWLRWLPGAVRGHSLVCPGDGQARVVLDEGALDLRWQVLSPRRIALISMPRMRVTFDFGNTPQDQVQAFLRYFDLYMQRGGG
jgi:hypothetical protein